MKITVVGAGMVGSTFAYRALVSGLTNEIVLIDVNKERALGEAEDMSHAIAAEHPAIVRAGEFEDAAGSDFVVITAGLSNLKDGTRLDLCAKNAEIFRELVPNLVKHAPNAIYVVASNPADVMAYATLQYSGLDRSRVIGSGTVLDSDRLREMLSAKTGVSATQIDAYSMGEHGDSQVPIFSQVSVRGIKLDSFMHQIGKELTEDDKAWITDQLRTSAYRIIARKNATYYGIASALLRIVRAVWRDENVILPVSTLMQGEYGLNEVFIAAPTLINRKGAGKVFDLSLSGAEYAAVVESANVLKGYNEKI